eukprot:3721234-Rhodomonas_salina.3
MSGRFRIGGRHHTTHAPAGGSVQTATYSALLTQLPGLATVWIFTHHDGRGRAGAGVGGAGGGERGDSGAVGACGRRAPAPAPTRRVAAPCQVQTPPDSQRLLALSGWRFRALMTEPVADQRDCSDC